MTKVTKKITKAVIPAAGLGTRMLPISRAVPKEMLPIVDKPAISYLIEEACDSGITDILIITARGKEAIEDYYDYTLEYEVKLRAAGRDSEIQTMRSVSERANIYFLRQREAKGLGHAVGCARGFTGDEPFVVLYGDDVIVSKTPVCKQLMDVFEEYGLASVGVQKVPVELIVKYCTLKTEPLKDNWYKLFTMIEKPKLEQIMEPHFSILGRALLTPEIYDLIADLKPGAGGELQLTDAMKVLAETQGMTAVDFEGTRYDMGSKLGFLMANVEQGLLHPELGDAFKNFLKMVIKYE